MDLCLNLVHRIEPDYGEDPVGGNAGVGRETFWTWSFVQPVAAANMAEGGNLLTRKWLTSWS